MVSTKFFGHFHVSPEKKVQDIDKKIMIVMHGLGDSLDAYVPLVRELSTPELHYLVINAPKKYFTGYSWYDLPPSNPIDGVKESTELLHKLINELKDQGFKSENIFILGFSQGGCLAINCYLALNEKLGGVVALSPRMYLDHLALRNTPECRETPLFIAHGEYDPVIDHAETKAATERLTTLGHQVEWQSYPMQHQICMEEIEAVRIWLNQHK